MKTNSELAFEYATTPNLSILKIDKLLRKL
jgi:hypothetical protein